MAIRGTQYRFNGGGTPGAIDATYRHDAAGRRIRKLLGSNPASPKTALDYYHNTGGQIIEVRKGGSEYPLEQYLWSPRYVHAPILRWRDSNTDGDLTGGSGEGDSTLYYCTDANFNVTALVSAAGTVVERYLYDPYGKVTVCDGSWTPREGNASAYSNEVLFTGHRLDPESGLYYTLWRHYHPTLGDWTGRDPKGYVDGMGLYEYCGADPESETDPTGLESWFNDNFKAACGQAFQNGVKAAADGLNTGGMKGALKFVGGIEEAATYRVIGGIISTLDCGARVDRMKADALAEVRRRVATDPDASDVVLVAKSVTVAVNKNYPVVDAVWGAAEGWANKGIGGVTHGKSIFANEGERYGAIANGVATVTGTAAFVLKVAGFNPELRLPGTSTQGEIPPVAYRSATPGNPYPSGEAQGVVRSVADGKLTGYTRHGLNQAIGRDGGAGVAPQAILDAVKSPVEVIQQSGGRTLYVGQNAKVVLNQNGQVITTWATNSAGIRGAP